MKTKFDNGLYLVKLHKKGPVEVAKCLCDNISTDWWIPSCKDATTTKYIYYIGEKLDFITINNMFQKLVQETTNES